MPFVNEFVSDDVARKHGLGKIFKKHFPKLGGVGLPDQIKHQWTVDKEKGDFLYWVGRYQIESCTGYTTEPTNEYLFVFFFQGKRQVIKLDREFISMREPCNPYYANWTLLSTGVDNNLLIGLHSALMCFGSRGASGSIDNPVVQLKANGNILGV